MALVLAEAGESSIVLGGDHPWTAVERGLPHAVAELETLPLTKRVRDNVEHANALRLLGGRGTEAYRRAVQDGWSSTLGTN